MAQCQERAVMLVYDVQISENISSAHAYCKEHADEILEQHPGIAINGMPRDMQCQKQVKG